MRDIIPFLETKEKGCKTIHAEVIKQIVNLFAQKGYSVNYSHVELTIPKDEKIPLKINDKKGRRRIYDIGILYKNKIIYIEVDIRDVLGVKNGKIRIK